MVATLMNRRCFGSRTLPAARSAAAWHPSRGEASIRPVGISSGAFSTMRAINAARRQLLMAQSLPAGDRGTDNHAGEDGIIQTSRIMNGMERKMIHHQRRERAVRFGVATLLDRVTYGSTPTGRPRRTKPKKPETKVIASVSHTPRNSSHIIASDLNPIPLLLPHDVPAAGRWPPECLPVIYRCISVERHDGCQRTSPRRHDPSAR